MGTSHGQDKGRDRESLVNWRISKDRLDISWLGIDGFPTLRPHQADAIDEVLECYDNGARLVWLDAPTGSGKTLIGEVTRRVLGAQGLYVCSGISLQQQFAKDFKYAKVLKGRANYPTQKFRFPEVNCGDCTGTKPGKVDCNWCDGSNTCPYEKAKLEALRSDLAVLNTTYFLYEANYNKTGPSMSGRELVVIDEADVLESELMRFIELDVPEWVLKIGGGVTVPKDGTRYENVVVWLEDKFIPHLKAALRVPGMSGIDVGTVRRRNRIKQISGQALFLAGELKSGTWVRDTKKALCFKPVKVGEYGVENLWAHGNRFLGMSATLISSASMNEATGAGTDKWEEDCGNRGGVGSGISTVTVPMTFPRENRLIRVAGVGDMSAKGEKEGGWDRTLMGIGILVGGEHRKEKVLIHTHSYKLTKFIAEGLDRLGFGRRIHTYYSGDQREVVLEKYRKSNDGILVAPSMDRGVDLPGDQCRVVIIAKVPFPYLGDPQIGARMNGPGGNLWYSVETIRSLVQMTGRGVRSKDDWCVSYIMDENFTRQILGKSKGLLPRWWLDAIDRGWNVNHLLREMDKKLSERVNGREIIRRSREADDGQEILQLDFMDR